MKSTSSRLIAVIAVGLGVLGGRAMSAQDKYTVQVPDGLAFSEFKGFEDWQTVAVSQATIGAEKLIEVILGNPAMIDAYRAGAVGEGKHFPDGARMAKIHWNAKQSAEAPSPTIVADTDFRETKSDFLKTVAPQDKTPDWSAWDSGKPAEWGGKSSDQKADYQSMP